MSKLPHEPLTSAWSSEVSVAVARRPSWMARKSVSTKPPAPAPPPSVAPAPPPVFEAPITEVTPAIPSLISHDPAPVAPPSLDLFASEALAQITEENAALRAQVAEMASTMARLRRQVLEASEAELIGLAVVIAERVVARELTTSRSLIVAWAREAIDTLAAKDEVVIAVAKDVAQEVPSEMWAGVGVEHQVVSDSQLAPGAIEVRTPQGTLATGAEARMTAVAQALGVERPA